MSGPPVTDPARSDTSGFTPLSITATVTPCPWLTCHAAGALIASRTHIWASRTLSARAGPASMVTARAAATAAASTPARRPARASRRGAAPPGLRSEERAAREGSVTKAPRRRAGDTAHEALVPGVPVLGVGGLRRL